MARGNFLNETGVPTHIQTVISNVFIFDTKVYKFYKNNNTFFNEHFRNISGKESRFSFTEKDFAWNSTLSPSVHIEIKKVAVQNERIVEVTDSDEADELVIVMNKCDTKDILYQKLVDGRISSDDCCILGQQLGEKLKKAQHKLIEPQNFDQLFANRIHDAREWMSLANDCIPVEESEQYCNFIDECRKNNKALFDGELSLHVTNDGDFHSQNVIYSKGKIDFIDTYPPKDEWGFGYYLFPLYRIGVDMWALSGRVDFFETFIKGYESTAGVKVDRRLDKVFVIYVACIAVSYLYMLQRTDSQKREAAERFHVFIRNYFEQVKSSTIL